MAGGRPKGIPKTGGRKKGTPNRITMKQVQAFTEDSTAEARAIKESVLANMKPVDVMLMVMRKAVRAGLMPMALAAAEKAAPYCHARLQNVTMDATVRRDAADFSDAELNALVKAQSAAQEGEKEADGDVMH